MRYYWDRFKKPIVIAGRLILIFGVALLVVLYYFGYYDLSFIDRYRSQLDFLRAGESADTPADPFAALVSSLSGMPDGGEEDPLAGEPSDGAAGDGAAGDGTVTAGGAAGAVTNVSRVWSTDALPDARIRVSTVSELEKAGLSPTSPEADFVPGRSALGRVTFSFQLPEDYGTRYRVAKSFVLEPVLETDAIGNLHDYGVLAVKKKNVRELRPSVECYMGYLLIEADERIVVCSSDGTPLCAYSPSRYSPAYARDRAGHPLFVRREDGRELYFYLSSNGLNFIASDYDPVLDSRGLSFDYPADYGRWDEGDIYLDYDEETGRYAYLLPPEELPEPEDGEEGTEEEEDGGAAETEEPEPEPEPEPIPLTGYDFTGAHPFVGGVAAVESDQFGGSLYFIKEDGEPLYEFETVNEAGTVTRVSPMGFDMVSSAGRYQFTVYCPPFTTGIESIGSFYFDHNLVRVRKRVIDNWWYFSRSSLRVAEEYDVLLKRDGSEYPLPIGFSLTAYSEGMLMLERDGLVGFLSCTGEWIAQPIYAAAKPFQGGLAALETPDGRWGLIDTAGNIVLPFTYDSVSLVSDGVIACWREENGWSVLRIMQ